MSRRPKQFDAIYSSIFQDSSVVDAYRHRPTYPAETFTMLSNLIPAGITPKIVLDAGCGTGFIARPFAAYVDHIDAVDISERMIAMAQTLEGGESANITWIAAPIETAPLSGPYALIVAAESLHWMDWERTLPHFAHHLVPNGMLALVEIIHAPNAWDIQMGPIIQRYSMNKDYGPYSMTSLADELEKRRLFQLQGRSETAPEFFSQPVDSYIESFHARNGLSRDRMDAPAAAQLDAELRALLEPLCPQGIVKQRISARIHWGRPL